MVPAQLAMLAGLQAREVQLLIPEREPPDPEVSIVIPALNEELTISEFVEWCKAGLREAGVRGEILIVDSSSDSTAELALAGGARVLKTPKRGLDAPTLTRCPSFAASTCCWVTPI